MALFAGKDDEAAREGATLLATVLIGWMPEIDLSRLRSADDEPDQGVADG